MSASTFIEDRQRQRTSTDRSNNWWALVLIIFFEAMFFASLISAYLFLRFQGVNWLPTSTINMDPLLPGVNTVVLLLSSLAIHRASSAIQDDRRDRFQRWLPAAAALGGVFLLLQVLIFTQVGFTPFDRAFGSMFFALTGLHALRIILGIGLMLYAFVRSLFGQLTAARHFAVKAAATYWHFLDAVWILLFAVLYLL